MAKESLYSPQKAPIFKETFADEQTTRALGGVPTSVTYANGTMTTSSGLAYSSYTKYKIPTTLSVRLRVSGLSQNTNIFFSICSAISSLFVLRGTSGSNVLDYSSGTPYINGVAGSTLASGQNEIVITGVTINGLLNIVVGNNVSYNAGMSGVSFELCEIYDYTLTANEVANLYLNRRYNGIGAGQTFVNENYFVGNGASNTYATTPDSVASSPTGDIELIAKINIDAISNQGSIISKASVAGGDFGYNFFINSGILSFAHNPTGDTATRITSTCTANLSTVYTAGNDIWVKMTRSASTGDIKFYYSYDGSTYTQLGTTVSTTPSALYDSTLSTYIGNWANTLYFFSGRIYYVSMSSTIGGSPTVVFNPNSYNTTTYASTWTSTTGEVWTMTQTGGGYIQYAKKEILNIDAKNGCICDKWGNTITNTAVTLARTGSIYSMLLNGTSSRLNLGTFNTLVGNKTFICWINTNKYGVSNPRIIDNSKLLFYVANTGTLRMQSDGFTDVGGTVGVIKLGSWVMVVATRTSAGVTNFYVNGVLSGTANQSSGTPVAGSTCYIGVNSGSEYYTGYLSALRIINGILTAQEISQLFSNERRNYNV